ARAPSPAARSLRARARRACRAGTRPPSRPRLRRARRGTAPRTAASRRRPRETSSHFSPTSISTFGPLTSWSTPSKTPTSGVITLIVYLPFGKGPFGARGYPFSGGVPLNFSGAHFVFTASNVRRARADPFGAIVSFAAFGSVGDACFASFGGGG